MRRNTRNKRSERIVAPPEDEVWAILRAADELIGEGGRTLLSKVLKGSKDRKLLELGLDRNPSYGAFRDLTMEQIMGKVDRMIDTGFLYTRMEGRMPVILFTARGWAIERERRAEEFLQEWNFGIDNGITPVSMEYLKDRNRGMMLLFLYKILCSGDKKYIRFLTLWEAVDYKKVRAEIRHVVEALNRREQLDEASWEQLKRERAATLLVRGSEPVIAVCLRCDGIFVFDESDPESYADGPLRIPEWCPHCRST